MLSVSQAIQKIFGPLPVTDTKSYRLSISDALRRLPRTLGMDAEPKELITVNGTPIPLDEEGEPKDVFALARIETPKPTKKPLELPIYAVKML